MYSVRYSRPFIHPAYTKIVLFVQLATKLILGPFNSQHTVYKVKEQHICDILSFWLYNYVYQLYCNKH